MLLCYDLCFPPSPSLYSFFFFLSFLFSITRDLIPWKFDTLILSPWTWNYLESTILKVYPSLSNPPPHLVSWVFDYPKATGTLYYKELPYLTYCVPHMCIHTEYIKCVPKVPNFHFRCFSPPCGPTLVLLLCDLSDIRLGWIRSIWTPFSLSFRYFPYLGLTRPLVGSSP